jgi:hydrogenase expression/formation protein HypC
MCRAAPAQVTRIEGDVAWISVDGRTVLVSLAAVEHVEVSDYVLHHAGMVIERLEPDEALAVLEVLAEIDALNQDPVSR